MALTLSNLNQPFLGRNGASPGSFRSLENQFIIMIISIIMIILLLESIGYRLYQNVVVLGSSYPGDLFAYKAVSDGMGLPC